MNGFVSPSRPKYGTALSAPRSMVRIVTARFGADSMTERYARYCSSSSGTDGCVRKRYSVRYRPTPAAQTEPAASASFTPLTLASNSTATPSLDTAGRSQAPTSRPTRSLYSRCSLR